MGWETRKRGGLYYTRSRRVNGRVVREYVGGGLVGELAAAMDADDRAEREAEVGARRADRARLQAVDAVLEGPYGAAEELARASLILAGYHRHHRGEWRRRRD